MEQAGLRQQSLASTPATIAQKRFALAFSVAVACVVLATLPFARYQLLPIPKINYLYAPIVSFADLITAYLLFGQFIRTRQPFLVLLSATYLFSSLIIVPFLLAFPDPNSINNWPIVGSQTAPWLGTFWRLGFPLGIFAAMVLEIRHKERALSARQTTIASFGIPIIVLLLIAVLCFIAVNAEAFLPVLVVGRSYSTNTIYTGRAILAMHLAASAICIFQMRRGMVLHMWLSVAAVAATLDAGLSWISGGYYSIGWYLSRFNTLIAATVVLAVLLYRVNRLYETLAQQNDQLEQHREDLEKKNEQLKRQNQMQKDFVSIVGHEFRTALTTIQGFGEVIAEDTLTSEEIREYVGDMCSEAHRLSRLITEQLDLDRMQSGQMQLKSEVVDLKTLIEEMAHKMGTQSLEHEVRLDLERSLPSLWADRDRMSQVLLNLLSNAIKYSPAGGEILISSKREGAWVHITVQDQGLGIPQEKLARVFEQYTRVDSESSRFIGGTGLGLSVVKQIVEMHGGTVSVESVVDKGSTFHVQLPLVRVPILAEPVLAR
jgi:signal transduction histidine kinase